MSCQGKSNENSLCGEGFCIQCVLVLSSLIQRPGVGRTYITPLYTSSLWPLPSLVIVTSALTFDLCYLVPVHPDLAQDVCAMWLGGAANTGECKTWFFFLFLKHVFDWNRITSLPLPTLPSSLFQLPPQTLPTPLSSWQPLYLWLYVLPISVWVYVRTNMTRAWLSPFFLFVYLWFKTNHSVLDNQLGGSSLKEANSPSPNSQ